MTMKRVLVLNSGSSSIKYQLFDMVTRVRLANGLLERIGEQQSQLTHETHLEKLPSEVSVVEQTIADHREGMQLITNIFEDSKTESLTRSLLGVGHRVVHGGESFRGPTLINDQVMDSIRKLNPLAPLHNPANVMGIEVSMSAFPEVPQVAVFDTAFHQTLPPVAYHYALPYHLYEQYRIRRYGFHGTSHHYVAKQVAAYLERPLEDLNMIVLHLGSGASATAISKGHSRDTSMGLTPLAGLVMGTRSGDLDPAIIFHLGEATGKSVAEINQLLNQQSGLKGICGVNDMREVLEMADAGDELARLAVEMFTYRIKKYLGAYYAVMGRLDAIAFTGGIGENSAEIRYRSCDGLDALGITVDRQRNAKGQPGSFEIQSSDAHVKILVVQTNEELEIAEQTMDCIKG